MSLIYCNDLTFKYDGHIALQNATFHVNEGDYLGIVGENGSGKSTLIKGILNLLSDLGISCNAEKPCRHPAAE